MSSALNFNNCKNMVEIMSEFWEKQAQPQFTETFSNKAKQTFVSSALVIALRTFEFI